MKVHMHQKAVSCGTRRTLESLTAAVFALSATVVSARTQLQPQPETVLVIKGATLIDGNGGRPRRNTTILIRGDRFARISARRSDYPAKARVIDARGKYVIPGLIDAHLHYSGFLSELLLAHGITTAFDISGRNFYQVVQRDAIARGRLTGPRLFVPVDSVLAPTRADGIAYGREGPRGALSPAQAAGIARGALADGADYVNIRRGLTVEAFTAAVQVAHAAGKAVVAQPIGPHVYAREAVLAGADILEHAAGVSVSIARDPTRWKGWGDDEIHSLDLTPFADMDNAKAAALIKLMVAQGVAIEPDLIAEGRGLHRRSAEWAAQDRTLLANADLAYIPPGVRAKWLANYTEFGRRSPADRASLQRAYANYARFIGRFAKAGGRVLTGDDTSYSGWAVPGVGVHRELQLLVDAGLTPMQAILAATRNPAQAFRVADRIGTIEAGKFADLVILDANPLTDIRNTERIAHVVQGGKVLDRTYNRTFVDRFAGDDLEAPEWFHALQRLTMVEGNRTLAGLTDETAAFGQPAPGIGSIAPLIQVEGHPGFVLTIKGVNFTTRSTVTWAGRPVPARMVSPSEMQVMVDSAWIAEAGMVPIQVTNPGPDLAQQRWGNVSNRAFFIVNIR